MSLYSVVRLNFIVATLPTMDERLALQIFDRLC